MTHHSNEAGVFFVQALQLLLNNGLTFSNNPEMIWTRTGENSFSGQWQERFTSNVGYVFHRAEASIESLYQAMPSVQQWAAEVGSYFPNHRYVSSQQRLPIPIVLGIDRILRILGYLLPSLTGSGKIPFTTAIGLALAQLNSYLRSDEREYQSWVFVLANARIMKPFHIDDSVEFRSLTDAEAHYAASGIAQLNVLGMDSPLVYQNVQMFDWFSPRTHRSIIEIRVVRDGKGDETMGPTLRLALDLVSTLRLVKGGGVQGAEYWLKDGNPWAPWPYSIQRLRISDAQGWLRDATMVDASDARTIGQLCRALQGLPVESPLRRVLSRVEDSFGRVRDDDRLLDCWMGLEMLFTDPQQRVNFNPSGFYRCSWYLADNYEERANIFKELQFAAKQRNRLVHRHQKSDHQRIRQCAEITEKLLVRSLSKAIGRGIEPDLAKLDARLLGS
jgi:hypothetical protein